MFNKVMSFSFYLLALVYTIFGESYAGQSINLLCLAVLLDTKSN